MSVDRFGRDPLTDDLFSKATNKYRVHIVAANEVANPQAISAKYYSGNLNYFDLILWYNGLVHQSEIVANMRLRIPILATDKAKQTTTYIL